MESLLKKSVVLCVLMVAASFTAAAMRPDKRMSDMHHKSNYSAMMPERFGDWVLSKDEPEPVVNPQQQELLDSLYTEIVARTYVYKDGRKIMLSLAYGDNQSHGSQIHKPEVCYPAQGFSVSNMKKEEHRTQAGVIPVMRLIATHGQRVEPVTYWIRVGNKVVRGAVDQNLARVAYGLQGYIPDGLLFRVSEISSNPEESFALQNRFIDDLLQSLNPTSKAAIIGTPG